MAKAARKPKNDIAALREFTNRTIALGHAVAIAAAAHSSISMDPASVRAMAQVFLDFLNSKEPPAE